MNMRLKLAAVPLIGAMLLASGCAPDATTGVNVPLPHAAKAPPPVKGHDDGNKTSPIVTRDVPLKNDISVSATIDSTGGTLYIPAAGATLTFAPGAVSAPTVITFTAMKGPNVAYGFAPHGLVFAAPVTLVQEMGSTSLKTAYDSASVMHGAYIPERPADINSDNTANVTDSYDAWTNFWVDDAGCDPPEHLALRDPALLRLHPERRTSIDRQSDR